MLVVKEMVNPGHVNELEKERGENHRPKQQRLLIANRAHQGDDQGGRHQKISVRFGGRTA